jgi:hypothetical protein
MEWMEWMEWNGMEWNGMEWNGMEWNGMEWNGEIPNCRLHTQNRDLAAYFTFKCLIRAAVQCSEKLGARPIGSESAVICSVHISRAL